MLSNNIKGENESSVAFLHSASFIKRFLTVLFLAPVVLWLLYLGHPYSLVLFGFFYIGLLTEWLILIKRQQTSGTQKLTWNIGGTGYISAGLWGFYLYFSLSPLKGVVLLLMIWATDIGAYFAGKIIGGPKLCPSISPNKTWSGSIGGTVAACVLLALAAYWQAELRDPFMILGFIILSMIGQLGDLLESMIKRRFAVKDTSALLPGHGGLLDRFDSLLAVGVVLILFLILSSSMSYLTNM